MNTHGTTSAPKMQHESGYLAGNFVLPTLSLRVGVLYRIFSHRQSVGSGASCIYMLCQRIARTKFNILTVILRWLLGFDWFASLEIGAPVASGPRCICDPDAQTKGGHDLLLVMFMKVDTACHRFVAD
jgi:hypothetical protein